MRPTPRFLQPLLAALALGFLLAVSGCSSENPSYAPAPPPGNDGFAAEPLFASDEEALEAAAAAYRAYYAVVDQILNDGGANPERLNSLVAPNILEIERVGYASFSEQGYRGSGSTSVDTVVLQQYNVMARPAQVLITIYACVDVSKTDAVGAKGTSVVVPNRQTRHAYEASFSTQPNGAMPLILSEENQWTGNDFCV